MSPAIQFGAIVVTCALLWSLESIVPLFDYRGTRIRHAAPNVGLTLVFFAMNVALSAVSLTLATIALGRGIGLLFLVDWPVPVEAALAVAGLDLFTYVAHLLMHKSRTAWRFHRVHHSDAQVDVTTAYRQHPGETVWRVAWQVTGVVAFGVPLWVLALYLTISSVNALFEHANIAVPERLDRALRLVFVTPNMHKWHHSRLQPETDSNYSNIFSVWDRLFGTYTASSRCGGIRYGLDGLDGEESWSFAKLLRLPFAR